LQINNPNFYKNIIQKRNPRGQPSASSEVIKIISYLTFDASPLLAGSMLAIDGGSSLAY